MCLTRTPESLADCKHYISILLMYWIHWHINANSVPHRHLYPSRKLRSNTLFYFEFSESGTWRSRTHKTSKSGWKLQSDIENALSRRPRREYPRVTNLSVPFPGMLSKPEFSVVQCGPVQNEISPLCNIVQYIPVQKSIVRYIICCIWFDLQDIVFQTMHCWSCSSVRRAVTRTHRHLKLERCLFQPGLAKPKKNRMRFFL
jgi:hypothetical protein